MNEHKTLEPGEKYLYVSILGNLSLRAYKNKDKKSNKEPDFKGEGIAIWINKKKKPEEQEEEEFI